METRPSFIPKKKLTASYKTSRRSVKTNLFTVIAVILFVVSIILAGGIFVLEKFKVGAIQDKVGSLERAKNSFEPDLIRELSNLDARLKSAQDVIDDHIALSNFFGLLEELTLKSVRFTSFSFSADEGDDFSVVMDGEADGYSSIALQADIFGGNRYIKEPIFSNFAPNQKGNIKFSFTSTIDRGLLYPDYKSN